MANYVTLYVDSNYPTAPAVQVADSNTGGWVTHNLQVRISLEKPTAQSTTHYKIWGINGVSSEANAQWVAWPGGSLNTISGTLANTEGKQYVYAKFKNDGVDESDVVTASGVEFSWTEPSVDISSQWETNFSAVDYDGTRSAKLRNIAGDAELTISKDNIPGLSFNELNLSGFSMAGGRISATGKAADFVNGRAANKVSFRKVFSTARRPFITLVNGSTENTLTKYDGSIKTAYLSENSDRIENFSFNSGTKALTFDIKRFSSYGFAQLNKVEWTTDTPGGEFIGNTATLKVLVKDSNNEEVEGAPVTISGTGDSIGSFTSNPVNTNTSGIAIFYLDVTSGGTAYYTASVDDLSTATKTFWAQSAPSSLGRSLLRQLEQIRWTATIDDSVANYDTQEVAEPSQSTISGTAEDVLEHDMNVLRSVVKGLKGTTNWYESLGTYYDPTTTDSGSSWTKDMSLDAVRNNTLDSKTILKAVTEDNSGSGFTVTSGTAGFLWDTTLPYARWSNRRGLPIFTSTSGIYSDVGGSNDVCRIDLIDGSTGAEFQDASGNTIYAKFQDGADNGGDGYTGTASSDVYVKFYTDSGEYTWTGDDPSTISMVYPFREVLSNMEEYEWQRTDFVSSWEGDAELVEDVSNLWSFTGAGDDITGPSFDQTGNYYPLTSSIDNLKDAVDKLNEEFGDFTYTEQNYVTDNESFTSSLDALDIATSNLYDTITSSSETKYVEELSADLSAGTLHELPSGATYTPDATVGQEGKNMRVFVNGQLLAASTGAGGVNEDRDYAEGAGTTASGITFHFDLYSGTNVIYMIQQ